MLTIKAMEGGETYAAHHLSNNDYYSVGETITGQWMGRGAEMLGLKGDVNLDDFELIRKGIDPKTGEFLRPRQSADRYDADGKKKAAARTLYDFTISAPKAISVQSIEDARLVEAHRLAAAETIKELERLAATRVRIGGANSDRVTSTLVIAAYQHDTSRELDPQLHTHFVAGNLTYDPEEKRWKALQATEIYAERDYLTEVYRNDLAREVIRLGYSVEDHFVHGKDNGFGIVGILPETLDKFSQRSAQKRAAIQEFLAENGRLPSNNEIAVLVRESRPEKLTEITTAEVKQLQKERLTPEEATRLTELRTAAEAASPVKQEHEREINGLQIEEEIVALKKSSLVLPMIELQWKINSPSGDGDLYWEEGYQKLKNRVEEVLAGGQAGGYLRRMQELHDALDIAQTAGDRYKVDEANARIREVQLAEAERWRRIYEYGDDFNSHYEEWRRERVFEDEKQLAEYQQQLVDLEARDAEILLKRISVKAAAAEALAEHWAASKQAPDASLHYAEKHIFERLSVVKDYALKTEALRHGRGHLDLGELKGSIESEVQNGHLLTANNEVATRESLERERRMVAMINEGTGQYQPIHPSFVVSDILNPQQKNAVRALLASQDFAVNLRGAAGTGKTKTLEELHRGLIEANIMPVGVAPTTSAAEELQNVGFKNAMTISLLLSDPKQQDKLAGQVLIVDEAGMVGSRDMESLMKLAQAKQGRILYSGDTAQIKSVLEGDALRILERESNLQSVALTEVQRQTNAQLRAAVQELRRDGKKGFDLLNEMGAIQEVDWRLRARAVNEAYRAALAGPGFKGEDRKVLVQAATHDEIANVTHAIRRDRKKAGEIAKEGGHYTRDRSLGWTAAQKKRAKNYQLGQVVSFHQAVKGVAAKHESFEVIEATSAAITARRNDGAQVQIPRTHHKSFNVFEQEQIEVVAGDKLLLEANWRDKNFKANNGELVTVAEAKDDVITLTDGRQLPKEYRQFTHGYAITPHRGQGKTVDEVIVAAEDMTHNMFYVAVSRSREKVTVITSDSERLEAAIATSGSRQSAIELARAAEQAKGPQMAHEDSMRRWEAQRQPQIEQIQTEQERNGLDHGIRM
jgi:conjugative relaxase-like TrwC/TraI family protein